MKWVWANLNKVVDAANVLYRADEIDMVIVVTD